MKHCTKCDEIKPLFDFSESKNEKEGKQSRCKACNKKYKEARKERIKDYQLKYKFGISLELYNKMQEEQNYSCKICKTTCRTGRRLAVDHNHKTGKVRGLLCVSCNTALGLLNENTDLLDKCIQYLQTEGKKYGQTHTG